MPFLVDLVMGELNERAASRASVAAILVRATERGKHGAQACGTRDAINMDERARELHPHPRRAHRGRRSPHRDRTGAGARSGARSARCKSCAADDPPGVNEVIQDLKANPPPPVRDRHRREAIQFLEWLRRRQFHACSACATTCSLAGQGRCQRDLEASHETGLGVLRGGDVPIFARRGGQTVGCTPQLRAVSSTSQRHADRHQGQRVRARTGASHLDYVGVKRFDADGNPAGEFRIVGLFIIDGLHPARRARSPYLRRKVDARADARRLRLRQTHSGKALVNVLRPVSARRAVPDRRGHALSLRARASCSSEERPRVRVLARRDRFDRFVSVLVLCAARALQTRECAWRSGEYLAEASQRPRERLLPVSFPDAPLTRVHFIIGRDAARRRIPTRRRWKISVGAIVRTGPTDLAERCRGATTRAGARACLNAIATRSPNGYRDAHSPRDAVSRYPRHRRRCRRSGRWASTSISGIERRQARACWTEGLEPRGARSRCRSACRCWRTWASAVDERDPPRCGESADDPEAWLHDMVLERAGRLGVIWLELQAPRWKRVSWW